MSWDAGALFECKVNTLVTLENTAFQQRSPGYISVVHGRSWLGLPREVSGSSSKQPVGCTPYCPSDADQWTLCTLWLFCVFQIHIQSFWQNCAPVLPSNCWNESMARCCCCWPVSSIAYLRCLAVSVGAVHSDSNVSVVGFEGQSNRRCVSLGEWPQSWQWLCAVGSILFLYWPRIRRWPVRSCTSIVLVFLVSVCSAIAINRLWWGVFNDSFDRIVVDAADDRHAAGVVEWLFDVVLLDVRPKPADKRSSSIPPVIRRSVEEMIAGMLG